MYCSSMNYSHSWLSQKEDRSKQIMSWVQYNNTTTTTILSGTTRVSWYQKKHSPTHHPDHHPIFISFFHLPRFIASSLFKLRAWQSFCTTSLHILFGLPLGLEPPPHIPYISSPNQCLLFAAHAHTIAACFAAVSMLYHIIPKVSAQPV